MSCCQSQNSVAQNKTFTSCFGNQCCECKPGAKGDQGVEGPIGPQGIPGPTVVSANAGNLVTLGTDGFLFLNRDAVCSAGFLSDVNTTPTVALTKVGPCGFKADVKVSTDPGNQVQIRPDGVYVLPPAAPTREVIEDILANTFPQFFYDDPANTYTLAAVPTSALVNWTNGCGIVGAASPTNPLTIDRSALIGMTTSTSLEAGPGTCDLQVKVDGVTVKRNGAGALFVDLGAIPCASVRGCISVTGPLTYNTGTGVISLPAGPNGTVLTSNAGSVSWQSAPIGAVSGAGTTVSSTGVVDVDTIDGVTIVGDKVTLLIDPASTATVTQSAAGLRVDATPGIGAASGAGTTVGAGGVVNVDVDGTTVKIVSDALTVDPCEVLKKGVGVTTPSHPVTGDKIMVLDAGGACQVRDLELCAVIETDATLAGNGTAADPLRVVGGGGGGGSYPTITSPTASITVGGTSAAPTLELSCEAVQDCVGPMFNSVGFTYNDASNGFSAGAATAGYVLTNNGSGGASWALAPDTAAVARCVKNSTGTIVAQVIEIIPVNNGVPGTPSYWQEATPGVLTSYTIPAAHTVSNDCCAPAAAVSEPEAWVVRADGGYSNLGGTLGGDLVNASTSSNQVDPNSYAAISWTNPSTTRTAVVTVHVQGYSLYMAGFVTPGTETGTSFYGAMDYSLDGGTTWLYGTPGAKYYDWHHSVTKHPGLQSHEYSTPATTFNFIVAPGASCSLNTRFLFRWEWGTGGTGLTSVDHDGCTLVLSANLV